MTGRPLLALDFDGVLCDSTEECIVTAWNAWLEWTRKGGFISGPEDVEEPFGSVLRHGRSYVRTAGEYLVLLEAARRKRPLRSQADYDVLASELEPGIPEFGRTFFASRKQLRHKDEAHWIGLHTIYPGIIEGLQLLWNHLETYVVTGKDVETVLLFFSRFGVPLGPERVLDKDTARDKLAAVRFLAGKLDLPLSETVMLDDNVRHLIPVHEAGCRALLAEWGYHTSEHLDLARSLSIPIVPVEGWAARVQTVASAP